TSSACTGQPITCTDIATVTVDVKPVPRALDDGYVLRPDGTCGPFDVRANDSPGTGCDIAGCGAACDYMGCPVLEMPPLHGTVSQDPITCQFTYTAANPWPGEDCFYYRIENNCGCCATARVTISQCPCINRLVPGSLLLFPEFDNRDGITTLL